jgi:hypothetical protein
MTLDDGPNVVLMGNITTGNFINAGTVVPSPYTGFNVQVP